MPGTPLLAIFGARLTRGGGRAAVLAALLGSFGCVAGMSEADRYFARREFAPARDSYLALLDRRDDGPQVERALLHLGLIYLQPDGDLYDPVAARAALTRLTYLRPRSEYAARASALLAITLEATRLRAAFTRQQEATRAIEADLVALTRQASRTEARSEDQTKQVDQLGGRISRLQAQISKLREALEATSQELAAREGELADLKRIDLEDPLR